MTARPKVLISAFSCNPEKGSEPGLGYHYIRALAEQCDLTVITEELHNRVAIEKRCESDPGLRGIEFHFIPWPSVTSDGNPNDGVNFVRYYRYYRQWQRAALQRARSLAASHKFDLLHHLTMTGYREPGYLWSLPLPFVWGPIGGFVMMPWRFLPSLGPRGFRQCAVRNVLNAIQARCSPRVRQAVRAARVLFASTSVDRSALARFYRRDAILLGENGADISQLAEPRQLSRTRDEAADVCRTPLAPREGKHHAERDEYGSYSGRYPQGGTTNGAKGRPLRIAWSGLHIPRKALPILLGAVELASKEVPVEVSILGDGPENSRWRSLAKRLKIDGLCRFYGWLPRAEAIEVMRSADLFAVTSLQDATSAVLFEALSAGLPVISHACCGFQDVLTDHCAVLVPMTSPTASIHGFAAAIKRVYAENTLYEQLSRGAIERARELSWENRANVILHAYQQVLGP